LTALQKRVKIKDDAKKDVNGENNNKEPIKGKREKLTFYPHSW
jgi:hypothetical protein